MFIPKKYLSLVIALSCVWLPLTQVQAATATKTQIENRVFKMINHQRTLDGLAHLESNSVMQHTARHHSKDMAHGTVAFGHDGFDTRIATIDETLGDTIAAAENVAHTNTDHGIAKALVAIWLNSAEHLGNIQTADFNLTGVGIGKSGDDYYCTQIFEDNH